MINKTIATDKTETISNLPGSTNNHGENHFMQGWQCPRCGRINAPWKGSCDCRPEPKSNFNWHGLPGDVWNPGGIDLDNMPKFVNCSKGNPCKDCSNNPDNGGSGNCNCILGLMNGVTC